MWNDVVNANPWLKSLGISTGRLKQLAATSSGTSELMAKLRQEDVVKRRTQAMFRGDGSRRFASEAELFQWENQVRGVLRQAGVYERPDGVARYGSPHSLIGFAESDLSPDEIRDRLQVWKGVKESGGRAREIFYVYSGLTFGDDDLFEALVDPAAAQRLSLLVNKGVAEKLVGPNAYQGWINRARQAGNGRIVNIINQSRRQGATNAAMLQRIINVDPQFANRMMDALYTGGDPDAGDFLDLTSLLDAYEFMAVGAAAQGAGLELPTKARLQQIRAAGIERSQVIDAYRTFGLERDKLNAAVLRARGETFTRRDFEESQFFGDPDAIRKLESGEAYRQAAGRSQGQFAFQRGSRGQFIQTGLSAR